MYEFSISGAFLICWLPNRAKNQRSALHRNIHRRLRSRDYFCCRFALLRRSPNHHACATELLAGNSRCGGDYGNRFLAVAAGMHIAYLLKASGRAKKLSSHFPNCFSSSASPIGLMSWVCALELHFDCRARFGPSAHGTATGAGTPKRFGPSLFGCFMPATCTQWQPGDGTASEPHGSISGVLVRYFQLHDCESILQGTARLLGSIKASSSDLVVVATDLALTINCQLTNQSRINL